MGRPIKKDSTDQSTVIRIIDSTTGLPETAVEYDTAGIDLWYRREGATKTSITEAALAALDSAHADGGIEHIGDGYYRLDLPDAAVATGSNGVCIGGTVTGMVVIGNYHTLTDYDPYDTVRLGLTALPNAAADAAGGLPVSDDGGLDMDSILEKMLAYVRLLARSDAAVETDAATELTAINADEGSGGGDFSSQAESNEAIKDYVSPANEYDTQLDANMSTRAPASEYDTEMARITGNVALASVVGALNDAAAAGEVTSADTLMQYIKQLINILIGSTGIVAWPASAAPGNGVSMAEALRAVYDDSNSIDGKMPTNYIMGSSDQADHDGDFNTVIDNPWPIPNCPSVMEIPEAGSEAFPIYISFHNEPDAAPTIAAANSAGTARDANLSAATMVKIADMYYKVTYTVDTAHLKEGVNFIINYVEGGTTRRVAFSTMVRDDNETKVDAIHTALLTSYSEQTSVVGKDASLADKIDLLVHPTRNGVDTDATAGTVITKNDDGTTYGTQTVTEDLTNSDIGKMS